MAEIVIVACARKDIPQFATPRAQCGALPPNEVDYYACRRPKGHEGDHWCKSVHGGGYLWHYKAH